MTPNFHGSKKGRGGSAMRRGVMCDDGLRRRNFSAKGRAGKIDARGPFHFASIMHFVVDRLALVKMVEIVARGNRAQHPKAQVQLTAVAPWVYAAGVGVTVGIETLVFRDGTCRLPCRKLLRVLKTYYPKANVTLKGSETGLRVERFEMCPEGFTFKASAPEAFQDVTADAWLAPKGPLAPPSANVPCAAPDETTQPPEARRRW